MRVLAVSLFLIAGQIGLAQEGLNAALRRIWQDYQSLKASPDIGRLVILDQELRFLHLDPWEREQVSIDAKYFKPEYTEIGLSIGHYSDALQYSGKLLVEAHRIDPNSRYRDYTFYSTILPEEYSAEPPQIDSAKVYLSEFPNGPYAFQTARILAEFYDDLYKAIRDHLRSEMRGEAFEFFSPFISNMPLNEQLAEIQMTGLKYYEQAIQLRPSDKDMKTFHEDLKRGTAKGWFSLPD